MPGTDEDAIADLGPQNLQNPVFVGLLFLLAVTDEAGPRLEALPALVTPESLAAWGDFQSVAEALRDATITTRANYPAFGETGVAYVKYVRDPSIEGMQVAAEVLVEAVIATLQYRPELNSWRVHAVGGKMLLPEELPPLG
ncbi:hypothetical protein V1227_28870 [Lentzea sp. DG1S-22]|uniref:hypothetical protein n=1 Tax=Lentzea sp. DG1S-22 TaxID=3108822 RepID=UPI002E75FBCB|nr:hypothetical protein [Lentzea sp. DG1S-22]WVH79036.1 hypothetical protein V1227_28870 [Lentzea sp. DG1S-22]